MALSIAADATWNGREFLLSAFSTKHEHVATVNVPLAGEIVMSSSH